MRVVVLLAIANIAVFAVGCVTERHVAPEIQSAPRTTLELKSPVLGAVFDVRSAQNNKEAAPRLQADLARIYGTESLRLAFRLKPIRSIQSCVTTFSRSP